MIIKKGVVGMLQWIFYLQLLGQLYIWLNIGFYALSIGLIKRKEAGRNVSLFMF